MGPESPLKNKVVLVVDDERDRFFLGFEEELKKEGDLEASFPLPSRKGLKSAVFR